MRSRQQLTEQMRRELKRDAAEELYEAALIGKRNAEWKLDHAQTRTARILAAEDLRAIDAAIVKASRRPA